MVSGHGAAVRLSAATMARATAFLGAPSRGAFGARVLANSLRELDRFLNLLIDEVAISTGPAAMDRVALARQRNTPNKLRHIRDVLGLASDDHELLRTIGRARERLFHGSPPLGGRPAGLPAWLDESGLEGFRPPLEPGRCRSSETSAELHGVCLIYDRIALELLNACEAFSRSH